MGRSGSSGTDYYSSGYYDEVPEHAAIIAPFALDRYEVTVSRFRQFVNSYDVWRSSHPAVGEGAHASAPNTGWGQSWTPIGDNLPLTAEALKARISCDLPQQNWTSVTGTDVTETYPMTCADWYLAFAFCIWDGGRLPTESEWEYAAAGGSQNRLYPWGTEPPNAKRANFGGSNNSPKVIVGSKLGTGGESYFGHADLAGSIFEWVYDYYSASTYGTTLNPNTCNNCVNNTPATTPTRVTRGGGWSYTDSNDFRNARRNGFPPYLNTSLLGFRCARSVN
jgi:formylglycine-generating enzyme required for sulfatase activity